MYKRDGLRGRGENPGAVVGARVSGESAEDQGISDFGSGKGAAAKRIRQAWQEQGRVRGGQHGQRKIGTRQGTPVWCEGYRLSPCGWMILCGFTKDVGGEGVR